MTNVDPATIKTIDSLAEKRFQLEIMRDAANKRFKDDEAKLKSAHSAVLNPIEIAIAETDANLRRIITGRRSQLIERGKKSFVTMAARFQFRSGTDKPKVTDIESVMEAARRLGVVRKVATPKYVWQLTPKKFFEWLERNDEHRSKFEDYIENPADEEDSLVATPNGTYTVLHNSKRVSPPSVTISKSRPR